MSLKENLNILEKAAEKYKTFSAPIEKKVTNIDKVGNESAVTISYKIKFINVHKVGNESVATVFCKIKFINSARFMTS